jgi:hypothetical protein
MLMSRVTEKRKVCWIGWEMCTIFKQEVSELRNCCGTVPWPGHAHHGIEVVTNYCKVRKAKGLSLGSNTSIRENNHVGERNG